jgi:hypothetical protein
MYSGSLEIPVYLIKPFKVDYLPGGYVRDGYYGEVVDFPQIQSDRKSVV